MLIVLDVETEAHDVLCSDHTWCFPETHFDHLNDTDRLDHRRRRGLYSRTLNVNSERHAKSLFILSRTSPT